MGHSSFKRKVNLLSFALKKTTFFEIYIHRKLQNEYREPHVPCTQIPSMVTSCTAVCNIKTREFDIGIYQLLTKLQTLFSFYHFLTCVRVCMVLCSLFHVLIYVTTTTVRVYNHLKEFFFA